MLSLSEWHKNSIHQAEHWPKVDAVVTKSQISYDIGSRGMPPPQTSISFSYTINGKKYTSSYFYIWGNPSAYLLQSKYPVGRHFFARYDPSNPEVAVVEPGFVNYGFFALSVILLLLSVAGCIYNITQR